LYAVGGVSGILFAVPGLVAMALVAADPPPLSASGAQTLEFVASHRTVYILEQILWLTPCLLAVPVVVALSAAVWHVEKSYALLVGVLGVCSWALGLALPVSGGGSPVLVSLSDQFTAATTSAQRAVYAGAAESLIAENNTVNAVGVLEPVGILLISLLLLRAALPRWVGWLGVVTGAVGVASESLRPVIGGLYAGCGTLLFVWFVAVGVMLLRLASETSSRALSLRVSRKYPQLEGHDEWRPGRLRDEEWLDAGGGGSRGGVAARQGDRGRSAAGPGRPIEHRAL
jgi:hypothetical protein